MSLPNWLALLTAVGIGAVAATAIVRTLVGSKAQRKKMKEEAFAQEVSAVEFEAKRLECSETGKPLVVLFHAEWCRACTLLWPIFHKVARQLQAQAEFVTVDVDAHRPLARQMKVGNLPTIYVLKGLPGTSAEAVDKSNGFLREGQLKQFLESAFKL